MMESARFLIVYIAAALALSCSGPAGARRSETGVSSAARDTSGVTLAQLEIADDELDDAITQCGDSCCIQEQPWWRPLQSLDASGRGALRELLAQERRPRIRALAIYWLAAARNVDDIPIIESFVDSSEPAWREPVPIISQMAMPCYPVASIRALTVGDVALGALGRITGKVFQAANDYRAWRDVHTTAAGSISYWHHRVFPFARGDACRGAIAELGEREPTLLIRLTVALWHRYTNPIPECPTIGQVAPLLRAHYGQDRLLGHLRDPSTWHADRDSDYAKDTDFRHFAVWALSNAEALFDPSHDDAIVALTALDTVVRDPEILAHAAVAAGRLRPTARDKIMDEVLVRTSTPPPYFVEELAKYRPTHPMVKKWFMGDDNRGADDRLRLELRGEPSSEAVARGLCSSGDQGIAIARALAADPAAHMMNRPGLIRALAEGAIARGAADDQFSCRQDLRYVCHKVSADVCAREERKEQIARRACLAAFEKWAARR